ncbi:hypothetical protein [Synoicihabitans lomoniglobus]|uniref:Glycosyl hydrolase family 32 N-terminal domain-containing protein n=1 Tax=Synoicihabitans lomoniglobus TaxID=2909285 RepID=A0AAF0CPA0_9BACT|nr:Gmad2 immunoglobulin-like domain-containing protein [Opitutaceae bacterium LMO-M01]WED63679.1 hypothetical protein PXH66_15190 [Opitutaceae bacterium LMO-M01]
MILFLSLRRALLGASLIAPAWLGAETGEEIGGRRELFVDDHLIAAIEGAATLRLHHPQPREIVLVHDAPWEGSGTGYHSVFQDGDRYRMYYKSWQINPLGEANRDLPRNPLFTGYAESDDGIHWRKPMLGLHEFNGSRDNAIMMVSGPQDGVELDAGHPALFKDTNPAAPAESRYKALFRSKGEHGLLAYQSPDGLHWSPMSLDPVITDGAFDSQNLAFWDGARGEYRAYWRYFDEETEDSRYNGVRGIRTATSTDFLHWENQADLQYPGAPPTHLYTNQIKPYHRAPHLLLGFPARYVDRGYGDAGELDNAERISRWSAALHELPEAEHRVMRSMASERYGSALTDSLLMASRDGVTFKRWDEAFLRPGIERPGTWHYGQQYLAWHLVETASPLEGAPPELSMYAVESYWTDNSSELRRYTLRLDGFVSVHAPQAGGQLVTQPIRFSGNELTLNYATSAAGTVRVEIRDAAGKALPGFALEDCDPLFGDTLDRVVRWQGSTDVSALADRDIQLVFEVSDGDLFSYQFRP